MTTAAVERHTGAGLAIGEDQDWWNDRQQKALEQLGVSGASQGDLLVFMHVAQRTGLDPFARQIYMIGRKGRAQVNGQWVDVIKQTIQTGIDGFRLIADRACRRNGETLEYEDTLWCDASGTWTDVWTKPTAPTAAKVTILRNGRRFSAVAMFREYVQESGQGDQRGPNSMWSKMPANQLAKCAEALVLRKAFPQDLSGLYTDDEMGQADRAPAEQPAGAAAPASGRARMAQVLGEPGGDQVGEPPVAPEQPPAADPGEDVVDGEIVEDPPAESPVLDLRSSLAKRMFVVLHDAGVADADQQAYIGEIIGHPIMSRKDLTEADASRVVTVVEDRLANPFPDAPAEGTEGGAE